MNTFISKLKKLRFIALLLMLSFSISSSFAQDEGDEFMQNITETIDLSDTQVPQVKEIFTSF